MPAALVKKGKSISLPVVSCFSLRDTLCCGQCFRWSEIGENRFEGVAGGRFLSVRQQGDTLIFENSTQEEVDGFWRQYFDLDTDYPAILRALSGDKRLAHIFACSSGIRILRQEPWEALCSFILSQNNNIKRISGMVERLCALAGKPLGNGRYAFPAPESLAALQPGGLEPVRAGFRARYVADAAQRVACGEIDLSAVKSMPLPQARETLMQICGVGPKVADCTLLYGFHRLDAFPVDTWMKKALSLYYPEGFPVWAEKWAGIAQQYLFHTIRNCPEKKNI